MIEQAREAVNALRMLENCKKNHTACSDCPQYYFGGKIACHPIEYVYGKLADLIESLAAELEQVKLERDAAIRDFELVSISLCRICKNYRKPTAKRRRGSCVELPDASVTCVGSCSWFEWRGVKEDSK